jgi:dTDP-glucose 4,6-dehydratase
MTVSKVLNGEKVLIHADAARRNPGSRFYIHARDVARAVDLLLQKGKPGEKYNVVGATETDNLRLARIVSAALGRNLKYELVDFHSSRPGHDLRYALDGTKLRALGWQCSAHIDEVIEQTALWYEANPRWLAGRTKEAA